MFGIGSTELLVILVVALIVLGPKNVPRVAQTLGKAMGEFRKYSTEFQRTLNTEIAFEEQAEKKRQTEKELEQKGNADAGDANVPAAATEVTRGSLEIPVPGTEGETGSVAQAELAPPETAAEASPTLGDGEKT